MANPERGEIDVKVGDKTYVLRPTFDAICELEKINDGETIDVLFDEIEAGRLSGLRACVWCLLQAEHADEIRTLKHASEWIERAGGPLVLTVHLAALRDLNTEAPKPGAKKTARPRKARAGTGKRSSSRRA